MLTTLARSWLERSGYTVMPPPPLPAIGSVWTSKSGNQRCVVSVTPHSVGWTPFSIVGGPVHIVRPQPRARGPTEMIGDDWQLLFETLRVRGAQTDMSVFSPGGYQYTVAPGMRVA